MPAGASWCDVVLDNTVIRRRAGLFLVGLDNADLMGRSGAG